MNGDGTIQHLTQDRVERATARFDEELAYAAKAEEHVWVAMTCHRLSADAARTLAEGTAGPAMLDAESIVSAGMGCYRCEQPLERRLIGKRCRGA